MTCPYCGAVLKYICPHCSREIKPDWIFCAYCCTKLYRSSQKEAPMKQKIKKEEELMDDTVMAFYEDDIIERKLKTLESEITEDEAPRTIFKKQANRKVTDEISADVEVKKTPRKMRKIFYIAAGIILNLLFLIFFVSMINIISGKQNLFTSASSDNRKTNQALLTKNISRLDGFTRYATAVAISKQGWGSSEKVILVRGDLFPDALAGATLASKYDCPILLTTQNILPDSTLKEISRLKAKYVTILGEVGAISLDVESQLTKDCKISTDNIQRIGGDNRYETATMVAKLIPPPENRTAVVTTGESFADAISSVSMCAFKGMPILLVKQDAIPTAVKETLKKLNINRIIIIGQPDVVSLNIENWLTQNGYNIIRLGGVTRYDTSRAIADFSVSQIGLSCRNIYIADGEDYPDALSIGVLAGKNNSPILLTREKFIPKSIEEFLVVNKKYIYHVYLAGGSGIISFDVENKIRNIIM